jgi:hypothetical protein
MRGKPSLRETPPESPIPDEVIDEVEEPVLADTLSEFQPIAAGPSKRSPKDSYRDSKHAIVPDSTDDHDVIDEIMEDLELGSMSQMGPSNSASSPHTSAIAGGGPPAPARAQHSKRPPPGSSSRSQAPVSKRGIYGLVFDDDSEDVRVLK